MTTTIEPGQDEATRTRSVSFDLTRKCQLGCTHCYNESGPEGTHGTMTREDWTRALDQAAAFGVATVQFIGGEPTMHPDFRELADHALGLGLEVEVFSNLVHASPEHWELYQRAGLSLATSYYSSRAGKHDAVTGRASHRKTRANIEKAMSLGVSLRVGIITDDADDGEAARADLAALGVTRIRVDRVRQFGRGSQGHEPDMSELCGQCGVHAAIDPTGKVSPCVMSGFIGVGNVRDDPLASIIDGTAMHDAVAAIQTATGWGKKCGPDNAPCGPDSYCGPKSACGPDDNTECGPGTPPSTCGPKR
ncbi:radical SAM protein [Streptacidiphilus albus]|uniref:radical SAM protein n=1 Tax=Streptacidiphilus albus TaxID=105425 RepID=UPI0005A9DAAC|nr:radical SAM protein [Streptacidiphilus albus]